MVETVALEGSRNSEGKIRYSIAGMFLEFTRINATRRIEGEINVVKLFLAKLL